MDFHAEIPLVALPPSARKDEASPARPLFSPVGLMEQSNASLQRGGQSSCEKADGPATPPERGPNLSRASHSRGHPLQLEKELAFAWGGGAVTASSEDAVEWLLVFLDPLLPGKMRPLHPDHFIHQGA